MKLLLYNHEAGYLEVPQTDSVYGSRDFIKPWPCIDMVPSVFQNKAFIAVTGIIKTMDLETKVETRTIFCIVPSKLFNEETIGPHTNKNLRSK